jgi:SAM-dependent methyltransferase
MKFDCNICGTQCSKEESELAIEARSCDGCGSCGRFRWIVHALSVELFGRPLRLTEFPEMRSVRGLGLSDWSGYAIPLAQRFDYTNTFFHMAPKFDIARITEADEGRYDFVIATEVIEHVPPPAGQAIANLFRILKPGGFVLLTTPSIPGNVNLEHFPNLKDYRLVELDSGWVLVNRTEDGRIETFEGLTFHGGDGSTVEMRVFGQERLVSDLKDAGFETVEVTSAPIEDFGILIRGHCSFPMVARKAGNSLDRRQWMGELAAYASRMQSMAADARHEAAELSELVKAGHDHIRRLDGELVERTKWVRRLEDELRDSASPLRTARRIWHWLRGRRSV